MKGKGFPAGLCELLRPFGERIQGNVIIRDGVGGSRAWGDFGVKFFNSEELEKEQIDLNADSDSQGLATASHEPLGARKAIDVPSIIDEVLEERLDTNVYRISSRSSDAYFDSDHSQKHRQPPSRLFHEYLRVLLSSFHIVPHETLCHPVACLIAVSSHNEAPIEALRQMYVQTSRDNARLSPWMGTDYLRYYVLLHDDENDDITKSTALFDLMKRHFGLHCHLLRLKSSECVPTDDDSTLVPTSEWLPAAERLANIKGRGK